MAKTKVKPKNATSKSDVWYKVLTVVIIVCLVAGLLVAVLQPTGLADYISLHSQTAMSTEHYKLNNAQFTYMTHLIYNNYQSSYGSSYTIPIEYCKTSAQSTLSEALVLYEAAKADGFELTPDQKAQIDDTMKSLEEYGKSQNYNLASTIALMYGGKGVKKGDVRKTIELQTIASAYAQKLNDSFTITDEEYTKQYEDNKNDYLTADYYSFTVKAEYDKDADDDAKTAAITAAKDKAKEIFDRVEGGEDFIKVVTEYKKSVAEQNKKALEEAEEKDQEEIDKAAKAIEDITEESVKEEVLTERHKSSDSEADKWIFADTPAADNAVKMIDADESATVYQIVASAHRDETKTVSMHYLYVPYSYFTDNKDAAEEFVKNMIAEYNKGEKTSDSFDALAASSSTDKITVSGGSYKESTKLGYSDSKYDEADAWLFSADRKAGDVEYFKIGDEGIVTFRFEAEGRAAWLVSADNDIREARLEAKVEEFKTTYPVTINEKAIAKVS